jgi:hypothetical protein
MYTELQLVALTQAVGFRRPENPPLPLSILVRLVLSLHRLRRPLP